MVADGVDQAHRALELSAVELLITDLELPDGSGSELVAWMRARGHRSRVLLASGSVSHDVESIAKEIGAIGWLQKPFKLTELLQVVDAALK